jgi:hypothetical protein
LDEVKVIEKYKETRSGHLTSRHFNVSTPVIHQILTKNRVLKNSSRKYTCNFSYFNNINTSNKAYWLGYLFADGCVIIRKRHQFVHSYVLKLKIKDVEMLELFNKCLLSNYPIKHERGTNCYSISIYSKFLVKNLIGLGCIPNKSLTLNFPTCLSSKLYSHFIRGYFDGDGSISFTPSNYSKMFNIVGTYNVILKIKEILGKLKIPGLAIVKYKNKNTIYYLQCQNFKGILSIKKYLYKNALIFLLRKKIIFEKIEAYHIGRKGKH